MAKPLISISNDDGYDSPGLIAVVAPVTPLSLDLTSRTDSAELQQLLSNGDPSAA